MGFTQAFKLALKSILSSKMRSLLTMLGIIIGVGSVIILISLMNGVTNEVVSAFESMGTNVLNVSIVGRNSSRKINVNDMYELYTNNMDVFMAMSPTLNVSGTIKYGTTTYTSTSLNGVSEDYAKMNQLEMQKGRFLAYSDLNDYHKVAVVGTYFDQEVFNNNSIGRYIKINGYQYEIVGVIEEQDDSAEGSTDDCIYIPYTTAAKVSYSKVSSFTFATINPEYNEYGTYLIENSLYEVLQNENYYSVSDRATLIETATEMTSMLTMVLVGIASISLLVGGIGIMNIMLVSVTERIREIGIRKSLGAKRRDIMSQFLIEAGTTSALGGIIGIVFGIFVSEILGNIVGINASPTFPSIMISFSISVFIGILFGFLPANKAAKLNPIDALRYD